MCSLPDKPKAAHMLEDRNNETCPNSGTLIHFFSSKDHANIVASLLGPSCIHVTEKLSVLIVAILNVTIKEGKAVKHAIPHKE